MADESYVARFECAVCQGTLPDTSFVALSCGHCFHSQCISSWLQRSSSCPACRAHASKRQLRALNGVDVVAVDAIAQDQQQQQSDRMRQVSQLQRQLEAAEQDVQELSDTVQQLTDVQAELEKKRRHFKHRCQELEAQRLQDSERLSAVSQELDKYREAHRTAVARLEVEHQKRKKAESDLQHIKLQNPRLSLACIERLVSHDQDLHGLHQAQLLAILAQRNEQLKQTEAVAARMQQQLQQEQQAAQEERAAVLSSQRAAEVRAAKTKEAAMKQRNKFEADMHMLQQQNRELQQQLAELQGVLLVLEGRPGPPRGQQQQQPQRHHQQDQGRAAITPDALCSSQELSPAPSGGLSPKPELQQGVAKPGPSPCAADWQREAAAAVGPGSLLSARPWAEVVPSFAKTVPGRVDGGGAQVQGQLLRHGPDGRGATAKHMPSLGKRGAPHNKPVSTKGGGGGKKLKAGVVSGLGSIASFFGPSSNNSNKAQ